MTRKFAIRLVLLLTVLFAFNACDNPATPHHKETFSDFIKAFSRAFGSMGKQAATTTWVYHSRIDCEGIVNNERVTTTIQGRCSAAEAESDGYTRCTLCCDEVQYQPVVR